MTDSRYKDFDQSISEAAGEPVVFKIRGEEFTLPAILPAIIPVKVLRLKRKYGAEENVPEEDTFELSMAVFGDQLDRLLATGISVDELGDIIKWVFAQYGGVDDEDDDPKNAPTPARKTGGKKHR